MTRTQRRNLANLVLMHGYDNVREFYGELVSGAPDTDAYPAYNDEVVDVLNAWHKHIIALADKVH